MKLLILVLFCAVGLRADITGEDPALNQCLCLDGSSVNVRATPCGTVIGSASYGECYQYKGNKQLCDLSGTTYEYFELDYDGVSGWITGTYLVYGTDSDCGIVTPAPDPEFRSYFVATAWNVDWPGSSSGSSSEQQQEMIAYLNNLDQLNMNAMVFQVRPAADAFYASSYEPWSVYLTGSQGVAPNPYYDPLQFTIDEAHARGIEVHAWLNPYRGKLSPDYSGLAPNHVCVTMSQYCYVYDNYLWLDPGVSEVVDHLINVITDIVVNYDVDGIHFDDYFYPYPDGTDFPDSATYQEYLNGGGSLSLDDWRRDNVNQMVSRVYSTIRSLSSTVKFSISPFGIYRPGHPEGMPSPISGLDPYTEQFADPKLWFQSGWLDFLAPQIYWEIEPPAQSYDDILDWWLQENTQNRHVYAANAVYKLEQNNWPTSEIVNQVGISRDSTRRTAGSLGNIHYSAKYFTSNYKGIADEFVALNPTPASTPPMSWLSLALPAEPLVHAEGKLIIWQPGDESTTSTYTLYKKVGQHWQIQKKFPKSVLSHEVQDAGTYALRAANRANEFSDFVTVRILDVNGKN